jgi:WD40 repeat protein
VLRFFDVIESSAPHTYESALRWSPSSSHVRALYLDQMSTDVKFSAVDDSWDACIRTIQLSHPAASIAFSNNDDIIAVVESGAVEIFEVATGRRLSTLTTKAAGGISAFSPDDTTLVTNGHDGIITIWDRQTGGLVGALEGHETSSSIRSVAFSPCGTMIASASSDQTIRVWNAFSFNSRCILKGHEGDVLAVCWSATGDEVISGSADTTVKLWDVFGTGCLKTISIHTSAVRSIASSPSSSLIASGDEDGTVKVFNAQTGDVLHTILKNHERIGLILFLNQDQITFYGILSKKLVIWDLTKSADVLTFEHESGGLLCNLAISSNGTRLASYQNDVVNIWQTKSPNQSQDIACNHTAKVCCISFSTDGQLAVTGSADGRVKIWDTSTQLCLTTFHGYSYAVRSVSISPNLTLCASWQSGRRIRIWDIRNDCPISTLDIETYSYARNLKMCFSQDGSQLALSVENNDKSHHLIVQLLEIATGHCLASMNLESSSRTEFHHSDISFDVDGSSIIILTHRRNAGVLKWRLSSIQNNIPRPLDLNFSDDDVERYFLQEGIRVVHSRYHIGIWNTISVSSREDIPRHRDDKSSWILDNQKGRVLWIPPDLRQMSSTSRCGKKVAFGSDKGRVTLVDFRSVEG